MKVKKNKQLATLLLIGGAFLLFQKSQQPATYRQQYANVPPPPAQKNSQQYLQWVKLITDNYGKIADLWKPGGPFYKEPVPTVDAGATFWDDVSNLAGTNDRFIQKYNIVI